MIPLSRSVTSSSSLTYSLKSSSPTHKSSSPTHKSSSPTHKSYSPTHKGLSPSYKGTGGKSPTLLRIPASGPSIRFLSVRGVEHEKANSPRASSYSPNFRPKGEKPTKATPSAHFFLPRLAPAAKFGKSLIPPPPSADLSFEQAPGKPNGLTCRWVQIVDTTSAPSKRAKLDVPTVSLTTIYEQPPGLPNGITSSKVEVMDASAATLKSRMGSSVLEVPRTRLSGMEPSPARANGVQSQWVSVTRSSKPSSLYGARLTVPVCSRPLFEKSPSTVRTEASQNELPACARVSRSGSNDSITIDIHQAD